MPFNPRVISPHEGDWASGESSEQAELELGSDFEAEFADLAAQLSAEAAQLEQQYPAPQPDAEEIVAKANRPRFPWWKLGAAASVLLLVGGLGLSALPLTAPNHSPERATVSAPAPAEAGGMVLPGPGSLAIGERQPDLLSFGEREENAGLLEHYMQLDASVREALDDLEQDGKLKRVPISL